MCQTFRLENESYGTQVTSKQIAYLLFVTVLRRSQKQIVQCKQRRANNLGQKPFHRECDERKKILQIAYPGGHFKLRPPRI